MPNIYCAVDTETTGLNIDKDVIHELAIIPLDSRFVPLGSPFVTRIKPGDGDWESPYTLEIRKSQDIGFEPEIAIQAFYTWFDKMGFGVDAKGRPNRIIPIGHNYLAFDMPFLIKLFGKADYEAHFHYKPIDTLQIAEYINMNRLYNQREAYFKNTKLQTIAGVLGVTPLVAHIAQEDCHTTAAVLQRLLAADILV
jgi:DNA polymerase III epsilon subunit-like protein